MTTSVLQLPWLPRPTNAERDALARVTGEAGFNDVERLRRLAANGWGEAELRSIGRRLRKALDSMRGGGEGELRDAGYTSFALLIIASRTMSQVVDVLIASALRAGIVLRCKVVEYHEPESWLAAHASALAEEPPDATLLALDAKALYLKASAGDEGAAQACIEHALQRHSQLVETVRRLTGRAVIVQTLAIDATESQLSMDAWLPGTARWLIAKFNAELAARARTQSNPVLDVAAIAGLVGAENWDPGRYWYVAKLPFAAACAPLYGARLVQLVAAMVGKSKRVLVLDLDNTIWGGIVGDDGVEGLRLGSGSAEGEAFADIQRMALHYKQRGVVLCVASKNTEEIALEAFRKHPEMALRESDVAVFQINWGDKASSIKGMAESLNLGLESFVLIDDNPAERKQVRDTLPLVAVPELPPDPADWLRVIQAAAYFEQTSFSAEDLQRSEYYKRNAARNMQAKAIGDQKGFLESLKMVLTVKPFDALGRTRITQLVAKSNQFNLTTRRYSESEIAAFEADAECETLQARLEDVFGDNGMISVVICRKTAACWYIDTWIMSCRVLGRGVERALLNVIAARARAAGAEELRGTYIPTAKNGIVRDHYSSLGFSKLSEENGSTHWTLRLRDFAPSAESIDVRATP